MLPRFAVFALVALLVPAVAHAKEPINTTLFGNKAIDGYDVVAYFKDGKPVQGDKQFTYEWKGAKWLFASSEHLEAFKASPEKFAPQYGGYCAYAMARGDKVGIDPKAWAIVDGKLFLNYDLDIKKTWDGDRAVYIKKADEKWSEILKSP